MHSCLNIDEILAVICSYLDSKQALLSFALSCTQFKDPALAKLWRQVTTLLPFLRLLPTDALDYESDGGHTGALQVLRRPLSPADWVPAIPYTPYVRDLYVDIRDSRLLNSIVRSYPGTLIFPSLRKLRFFGSIDLYVPLLKLLLSPCLTHLTLHLNGARYQGLTKTLSSLGVTCPSMIFFDCFYYGENSNETRSIVAKSLSKAITGWTELKKLRIPALTTTSVRHLSRLVRLESLILEGAIDPSSPSPLNPGFSSGFASLRALITYDYPLAYVVEFMRASETTVLEQIEISLPDDNSGTSSEWKTLFQILAQRSSTAKIFTLSAVSKHGMSSDNSPIVQEGTLRPLIASQRLARLALSQLYHLELSDNFIEELAKASPNLYSLKIGTARTNIRRRPTLTLRAYIHLFTHCPKLRELGLIVNTLDAFWLSKQLHDETQFHLHGSEFRLHVGGTYVHDQDTTGFSFFLSAFFRETPSIQLPQGAAHDILAMWKEVKYRLSKFIDMQNHKRHATKRARLFLAATGNQDLA